MWEPIYKYIFPIGNKIDGKQSVIELKISKTLMYIPITWFLPIEDENS